MHQRLPGWEHIFISFLVLGFGLDVVLWIGHDPSRVQQTVAYVILVLLGASGLVSFLRGRIHDLVLLAIVASLATAHFASIGRHGLLLAFCVADAVLLAGAVALRGCYNFDRQRAIIYSEERGRNHPNQHNRAPKDSLQLLSPPNEN